MPGPQATDRLLEDWAEALEDPDAGPVLWLALADTQWRLGRLEDRVRQQALDVIQAGRDLDRWESRADRRKRATVLEKLRVELNSPQRSPVKVRSALRTATPLRRGDAAAYRLGDGRLVVLRVVGHVGDERDNYPIASMDLRDDGLPLHNTPPTRPSYTTPLDAARSYDAESGTVGPWTALSPKSC